MTDLWLPAEARPSLAHIQTYVTWSEFDKMGRVVPQEHIVKTFGQFCWADWLSIVSRTAALCYATDPASSAVLQAMTWGVVDRIKIQVELGPESDFRDVFLGVARADHGRPFFHEGLGHLMAACAILFGADEGEGPTDVAFVGLMLALNDYVRSWRDEFENKRGRGLRRDEVNMTNLVHGSQYDHRSVHDARRAWVRARYMFEMTTPRNWKSMTSGSWKSFLDGACGGDFSAFFSRTLGVLHLYATQWGRADEQGGLRAPSVQLIGEEALAQDFEDLVRENTITRDDAKRALNKEVPFGALLPISPTLFFRKPFVELPGNLACAPVPRVVLDQCATGLWNRFRVYAGSKGSTTSGRRPELWTRAFGDIVEGWCHHVAEQADVEEAVILTPIGASDQIEDVVLRSAEGVVLFSVKARLLAEKIVKGAFSRRDCLAKLDAFLFADAKKGKSGKRSRRAGVLRQLDAAVDRARKELGLGDDFPVYPVLVTYDQYGLDHEPCYRWVHRRCSELKLFRKSMPVTLMTVNDFERLFAYGEGGRSIVGFMAKRCSKEGGRYPVHIDLADQGGPYYTRSSDVEFEQAIAEMEEHVGAMRDETK